MQTRSPGPFRGASVARGVNGNRYRHEDRSRLRSMQMNDSVFAPDRAYGRSQFFLLIAERLADRSGQHPGSDLVARAPRATAH